MSGLGARSGDESLLDRLPLVEGAVAGLLAFLVGYVLVYALTISAVQDAAITEVTSALTEQDTGWQVVGWLFYNAHFVTTTLVVDVPLFGGESAVNFIGESETLSPALYAVPPLVLAIAGMAAGALGGATDPADALRAGPTVAIPYLPLAVVGVFLFRVTAGDSWAGPTMLTGVAFAGLVYPVVFGAVGAALATVWAE